MREFVEEFARFAGVVIVVGVACLIAVGMT